ncbi:MFS transporter [Nocardia wallacei]|uniref:MFS transporter n=2 Tax=Nocardia wallacei TaxID=480035 RepID=UPI002457C853|nr:MFS transporter [Nocardia wallacei]
MKSTATEGLSGLRTYRAVLERRPVRVLLVIGVLGRIPSSAALVTLTLHVVTGVGAGYATAGLVAAAATAGSALGAPLTGRLIDRRGVRTAVALTTATEAVFWLSAPWLPVPVLVMAVFVGGAAGLPITTIVRMSLSAATPVTQRRPVFALDAVSTDLAYVLGPVVGVALVLHSSLLALWTLGAGWILTGVGLWLLNPSTAPSIRDSEDGRPRRGTWFDHRLAAVLAATATAAMTAVATELWLIASLESGGRSAAVPAMYGVWAVASAAGGFLYGVLPRLPGFFVLSLCLGATTLPLALADAWWSYIALLVPAGFCCAVPVVAGVERISVTSPAAVVGTALGLHSSALTVGMAAGTPLAGLLIDATSPSTAIACVAAANIVITAGAAAVAHGPTATTSHR